MGEKFITSDKIFYHLDRLNNWCEGKEVYPVTVEVHPSNLCNQKCYYCKYKKDAAFLEKGAFRIILRKLKSIKVRGIILSGGGEPLLNPDIRSFLKDVNRYKFSCGLITNLGIYDKFLFKDIVKFTEWCRISLDSSNKKAYKAIRGIDAFQEVINNIRRLVKEKRAAGAGATIGIQMVVCKENINEVFGVIKLARSLKVDYVQIRPLETLPYERVPYSKKDYQNVVSQYKMASHLERQGFKIIFSNKWDIINPDLKEKSHGFAFCHGYPFIGAVDARGDFYICCHKAENRNKSFSYGNIIKEPIRKIMARRSAVAAKISLKNCYLECRASNLNRRLEGLLRGKEHRNFL